MSLGALVGEMAPLPALEAHNLLERFVRPLLTLLAGRVLRVVRVGVSEEEENYERNILYICFVP